MSRMTGLIAATLIATASMVGVASAQHGMDDLSEHSGGHHHGGGGGGSDDPSEHLGKKHNGGGAIFAGGHVHSCQHPKDAPGGMGHRMGMGQHVRHERRA